MRIKLNLWIYFEKNCFFFVQKIQKRKKNTRKVPLLNSLHLWENMLLLCMICLSNENLRHHNITHNMVIKCFQSLLKQPTYICRKRQRERHIIIRTHDFFFISYGNYICLLFMVNDDQWKKLLARKMIASNKMAIENGKGITAKNVRIGPKNECNIYLYVNVTFTESHQKKKYIRTHVLSCRTNMKDRQRKAKKTNERSLHTCTYVDGCHIHDTRIKVQILLSNARIIHNNKPHKFQTHKLNRWCITTARMRQRVRDIKTV